MRIELSVTAEVAKHLLTLVGQPCVVEVEAKVLRVGCERSPGIEGDQVVGMVEFEMTGMDFPSAFLRLLPAGSEGIDVVAVGPAESPAGEVKGDQ